MRVQFLPRGWYNFSPMSPEEKALLVKTAELAQENNAILRKMRRAALYGRIMHLLYWVLIVALSLGAYYFIEPYVQELLKVYQELRGNLDAARNAAGDFGSLLQ